MDIYDLGPFDLVNPIASGGMGQVWLGRVRETGQDVAIKVLTGRITQRPRFRATFRNEARAMSGLSHPGIVHIYDYGEVPPECGAALHFGPKSPYIVMEFVESNLGEPRHVDSWPTLQRILLELLDGLAHAHARGVVHRDLKPGNVLYSAQKEVRITDFGIAFATEHSDVDVERLRAAGTPEYMAPEQCHGQWRDFGPWTDLYSLGCMAYAFAVGTPPFLEANPMATMLAKLEREPPSVNARFPVPDGFESWLGRLLQRSPNRRFQRAADAAWALRGLALSNDDSMSGSIEDLGSFSGDTLISFGADTVITGGFDALPDTGKPATHSLEPNYEGISSSSLRATRPPIPIDWRRTRGDREFLSIGSGLGLYALKQPSMVSREPIRDHLWNRLRHVHTVAQPRVVILKGPSGAGKSRLVEWLSERAHEVGAATTLHGHHSSDPGPAHGLAAMLMRHLRCTGLSRDDLRKRLGALLHAQGTEEPDEWEALTELMLPANSVDSTGAHTIRFFSLVERHLVVVRQLERMAVERSVVLWLDDIEWGYEALEFVQWLVDRGRGAFLVLMTTCEEVLSERPVESEMLTELASHDRVETFEVGPLDTKSHHRLVRSLLKLDPNLTRRVEERTAGNPLFAIQLIQDWIARDSLETGPNGYRLKPGAQVALPANLGEVWSQRVARLLTDRPAMDGVALELAAVLGQEVLDEEWLSLCRLANVTQSSELRLRLMQERLIRPMETDGPEGWTFTHGMLREALEHHAADNGRLRGHHLLVATMLRALGEVGERLAHHLRAGGDLEGAIPPYQATVHRHLEDDDPNAAEAVFNEWFDVLAELDSPADDQRWYQAKLTRAQIAMLRGNLLEAESLSDEVQSAARNENWMDLSVECHLMQARLAQDQGRYAEVLAKTEEFEALVSPNRRPAQRALCFWYRARALASLGQLSNALAAFKEAERFFLLVDDVVHAAHCLLGQARLACQQGAHTESVELAESAHIDLKRSGARAGVADALNDLGELARLIGDFGAAESHYRQARRQYEQVGSPHIIYAELNLAAVLLAKRSYLEAKVFSEKVLDVARRQGRRLHMTVAYVFLLSTSAQEGDWHGWDSHLRQIRGLLKQTQVVDIDIAHHLRAAADLAAAAGQTKRAAAVFGLSLTQWEAMDRDDEVVATADRMKALKLES